MRQAAVLFLLLLSSLLFTGCLSAGQERESSLPAPSPAESAPSPESAADGVLQLKIGETPVTVSWEENEAVEALRALAADGPLVIPLSGYGGFEQVGPIGQTLPRSDVPTTTQPGDIVLYSGNQVVVFYGSNSWSYTRLGHITDPDETGMTALLAGEDTSITLFLS